MRRLVVILVTGGLFFSLTACSKKTTNSSDKLDTTFAKALSATKTTEFKVTYKQKPSGKGLGGYTEAQDPPNKSMWSRKDVSYFLIDKKIITCTSVDTTPSCFETAATPGVNFLPQYDSSRSPYSDLLQGKGFTGVKQESSQTIAGRSAVCISFHAKNGDHTKQLNCIDKKSGVLLKSKTNDGKGHTVTVEASKYSSKTSVSDFKPPVEPQALDQ